MIETKQYVEWTAATKWWGVGYETRKIILLFAISNDVPHFNKQCCELNWVVMEE
jgi:hypothetical protein